MEKRGIDISSHQGIIDFSKVKSQVDFVMIRSGYGFYHEDLMFKNNADACQKYGIPYGFYHYSYATNVEDAKKEVEGMLQSIKNYQPSYPIVIDMEDSDGYKKEHGNPSNEMYVEICSLFCKELEKAGYYAMIYANLDWLQNRIHSTKLDGFDKWLAQWSSAPTYQQPFGIWQYSSSGKIDGITGNVDMDIAYKDYPIIIRKKGLNHLEKKDSIEKPNVDSYITYTIEKGDTLWNISEKFYGTSDRYGEISNYNNITDPNKIYQGEILKIPKVSSSVTYIVKKGDTLSAIAAKHHINTFELYNQNKAVIGTNPNIIRPGQILKIK